jgi:serine protease Do
VTDGDKPQVFTVRQGGPGVMALAEAFGQAGQSRLGVEIRDVVSDDVAKMKLASQAGVVIEQVTESSAAAKAGLKAGDVVVQFDGEQVRSASQFTRLVRETPVGRSVKMSVMRGGSRVELTATTEAQTAEFSWSGEGASPDAERLKADTERLRSEIERSVRERQRNLPERNYQFKVEPRVAPGPLADRFMWFGEGGPMGQLMSRGRLGVTIQDLTPELAEYFGVKDGVLVSSVEKDSAAAKAGIKAGDVITSVDGTAVTNGSGLVEQLRAKEGDVSIGLSREKKAMTLKATLEKADRPRGRIIARRGA